MNVKAVIFDMDGVLTDSEPVHLEAIKEVFKRHGIILFEADMNDVFGLLDERIFSMICERKGIKCPVYAWAKEKRKIVIQMLIDAKLKPFHGAKELVLALEKKYPIGLGTSSSHPEVRATLSSICLNNPFRTILAREDVRTHKPSPEVYRKLAKKLGAKPSECVVIEDSIAGVEAAKRAGAFCIAVLNSYPANRLEKADLIVKDLMDERVWRLLNVTL